MNFDINQTFQYLGFASEKAVHGINSFLVNYLPENSAVKASVMIYWISVLLVFWVITAIGKKINPIIRFILFLLIFILVVGYFLPSWSVG